jgi:hypothetical protein
MPFDAGIFGPPPGTPTKPWYKRPSRLLLWGTLAFLLLFLAFGFFLSLQSPERIKAGPAAAPPPGFVVVGAPEYEFAAPLTWETQVMDDAAKAALARNADQLSPGVGEKLEEAQNQDELEGTQTIATDPTNGDNVTVIPYEALSGDPRDADELESIKEAFSEENTGIDTLSVTAAPADVHGYPAATVTVSANFAGQVITLISTVIQTGDHVYQLTVSSASPERAASLSAQILPTFAPR